MVRFSKLSPSKRGYDKDWQRARARFLAEHPLCECEECLTKPAAFRPPATVVDHIVPIAQRPDLRLNPANFRAMAKAHHDRRTALDHIALPKRPTGCDADGFPTHPAHPWNRKKAKH